MRDIVPAHLLSAYGRLTESISELDTLIARASELPPPRPESIEPVDPSQLDELAKSPHAPPELRAAAQAVADGRMTWAEVVAGQAVPEHLTRQAAETPAVAPARLRRPRRGAAGEDFDNSDRTFLRNDW